MTKAFDAPISNGNEEAYGINRLMFHSDQKHTTENGVNLKFKGKIQLLYDYDKRKNY